MKYILSLVLCFLFFQELYSQKNENSFQMAEIQPEFKGGFKAFQKYIRKNLKYPTEARRQNVEGKVFLEFVIDADGSVINVKVIKGIGFGCDVEAVRVLKNSPQWIAGQTKGKPVKVKMNIPIVFDLGRKKKKDKKNTDTAEIKNLKLPLIFLNEQEVEIADMSKGIYSKFLMDTVYTQKVYGEKAKYGVMYLYTKEFSGLEKMIEKAGIKTKFIKLEEGFSIHLDFEVKQESDFNILLSSQGKYFEIHNGKLTKGTHHFQQEILPPITVNNAILAIQDKEKQLGYTIIVRPKK